MDSNNEYCHRMTFNYEVSPFDNTILMEGEKLDEYRMVSENIRKYYAEQPPESDEEEMTNNERYHTPGPSPGPEGSGAELRGIKPEEIKKHDILYAETPKQYLGFLEKIAIKVAKDWRNQVEKDFSDSHDFMMKQREKIIDFNKVKNKP